MTASETPKKIGAVLASFGLPTQEAEKVETSELATPALAQFQHAKPYAVGFQHARNARLKQFLEPRIPSSAVGYHPGEDTMFPNPTDCHAWAQHNYAMKVPMLQGTVGTADRWQGWESTLNNMGRMQAPVQYYPSMTEPMSRAKPERNTQAEKLDKSGKSNRIAADTGVEPVPQLHKTKLCSFFHKGLCTKGEACTYAHCATELEGTPNLAKTSLCLAWKGRTCPLSAAECRFAHGKHDLRTLPSKQILKQSRLLKQFNKGEGQESGDVLLMKLNELEGKESGADNWNKDTLEAGQVNQWEFNQVMECTPKTMPALRPPPGLAPPPGLCLPSDAELKSLGRFAAPESNIRTSTSTTSGSDAGVPDSDSDWSVIRDASLAAVANDAAF